MTWLRAARRAYTAALRLDALETLKTRVRALDEGVRDSKRAVSRARADHDRAQREIRDTAAEVHALLHRKASWGAADAERFSSLCRKEVALAEADARAGHALAEAEDAAEASLRAFLSVLRERYQEEMAVGEASRRLGYILTAANTILFGFAFFDRREQRARSQRIEGLIEGLQGKIFDGMTSEESSATLGPGLSESEKSGGEVYAGAPGDDDFTDDDFTAITADATKDESDDAVVVGDEERGGGASGHTSSDTWVKYGGWALAAVIFTVAMGVRSN